MLALSACLLVASVPTIDDIVSSKIQDLSFSVKVVSASRAELRKINKDFAFGYEAETVSVMWKEPLKIRVTSSYNGENAVYIINGDTKVFSIPRIGLKGKESIAKAPGKRQTLLDFGLVSSSMKNFFLNGTYVRSESGLLVFDLRYKYDKDKSRHRVWVDPAKRYVVKRMWYNQKGELMATFLYSEPVEVNGVWMPTKTTVKNAEDKTSGVTKSLNHKVNQGIADSSFKI